MFVDRPGDQNGWPGRVPCLLEPTTVHERAVTVVELVGREGSAAAWPAPSRPPVASDLAVHVLVDSPLSVLEIQGH